MNIVNVDEMELLWKECEVVKKKVKVMFEKYFVEFDRFKVIIDEMYGMCVDLKKSWYCKYLLEFFNLLF